MCVLKLFDSDVDCWYWWLYGSIPNPNPNPRLTYGVLVSFWVFKLSPFSYSHFLSVIVHLLLASLFLVTDLFHF